MALKYFFSFLLSFFVAFPVWAGTDFLKASSQYAESVTTVPAGPVISMACWYKGVDFATAPTLIEVSTGVSSKAMLSTTTGAKCQAVITSTGGTNGIAASTQGGSAGVWMHCAARFISSASRKVYTNGIGEVENTTLVDLGTLDRYVIGANYNSSSRNFYANGSIAECAVWDGDITSAAIPALAAGISPLKIRPDILRLYAPLYDADNAVVNFFGAIMTLGGVPTSTGDHPRIFQ